MRALVPTLPMNLLGTSHYASEMVVMRDHLPGGSATWASKRARQAAGPVALAS